MKCGMKDNNYWVHNYKRVNPERNSTQSRKCRGSNYIWRM